MLTITCCNSLDLEEIEFEEIAAPRCKVPADAPREPPSEVVLPYDRIMREETQPLGARPWLPSVMGI
jgi:hypothetical protein